MAAGAHGTIGEAPGVTEPVEVHVVSHTHWDREWYKPAVRFRQQLVALVDDLTDSPPADGASFLLDGQMSVIEDYLAIRPERERVIATLLARRAIEAGPWYVLADELMPGGEALVRNLLAGRRWLRRLGAEAPRVLYSPDSFGHPAAFPALVRGFGLPLVILSRGYGGARWPAGDTTHWVGPDGEGVLLYALSRRGYDLGENLPVDEASARARWTEVAPDVVGRSRVGVALLPNGADHHARQHDASAAVAALAYAARPHVVRASSLRAFVEAHADGAARNAVPTVAGELRDSYGYLWTLQGTFGTRAHQKRRNAAAERLLVRDVEPWLVFARWRNAADRRALLDAAWRSLLLCHPHDTLCGCSTDEVARAMDTRLDEAFAQGEGLRDDALLDLIGHDRDLARTQRDAWTPMTVIRNAAARARGGVARLRLTAFVSDVKVGANASPGAVTTAGAALPALDGVRCLQVLGKSEAHERTEAPRHYPDNDLVMAYDVLAWVPPVPAYGVACHAHAGRTRRQLPEHAAAVVNGIASNGRVSVRIDANGAVEFRDLAAGRTIANLLVWESRTDRGDLYTPSLREPRLTPRFRGSRVAHRGPLRASLEARWSFGGAHERVDVRVTLSVDADAPFVRVQVHGASRVSDHRLRIGFRSDLSSPSVMADAMFGPVQRVMPAVTEADVAFELPPATQPLHRYVTASDDARGFTTFSDGLAEYEVAPDGTTFVTLVRSVGELSRNDLPERPGHAGWPTPTPEAQCHAPFEAAFAVMAHDAWSDAVAALVERTADDVLLPLTGATLRSALHLPDAIAGAALEGDGLACEAVKPSDDGDWIVLRCRNVTPVERRGAWTLGVPVSVAQRARLDETPIDELSVSDGRIEFTAPAHSVTTVLVR